MIEIGIHYLKIQSKPMLGRGPPETTYFPPNKLFYAGVTVRQVLAAARTLARSARPGWPSFNLSEMRIRWIVAE